MQSKLFHQVLHKYWGYKSFRPLQEEIIKSAYDGNDTLGLMPTGGGKSLTFQVPVMAMEGICLVVTPLIALMKDQVDNLKELGIKAAYVYSGMSREQIITTLENCIFGDFKFLYVSPERLASDIFLIKLRAMNVCLLAVDESHCISQWGYDFRPSYLNIADIRTHLPGVPVLALTATATKGVVADIQEKLLFEKRNVFRKSFERKNLSYVVRYSEDKIGELENILNSVAGTAIEYVRSRKGTKDVAEALVRRGIQASHFHAGLSHQVKIARQNEWKDNTCRVIVSTNAFGMGIDKPDVRLVIHMDLPNSLEEYYQEAGRAGRDEQKSYAVVLWNKQDTINLKRRISNTFPSKEHILRVYECLANYYQIAAGSGSGLVLDFNLAEFCNTFRLSILQTHHALNILSFAGYIEYTDEVNSRSRLMFRVYRNELYTLALTKEYDELVQVILRNYTGVFTDNVYIDEAYIGARVGKTRQEVYEMLTTMSKAKHINYVPQKNTSFIIYPIAREENQFVRIPKDVYEKRKKRFKRRINAMINYVEREGVCRSRMLLTYFDERKSKNCGICDICLQRNKTGLSNYEFEEIRELLLASFSETS
ncbi:MAG: RecQ family ATP-dependent DNA helicase, partial [Bacteroidales bacterium]|nr:RecQ family ATP-dependent DNA helicase [Bacteroidales bacterium]